MTVDELVVKLTLDPSKFTKGQKDALAEYKKFQEGLRNQNKDVEAGFKSTSEALSGFRSQLLGLFALFTGGRGLKEFAQYLTVTNFQIGRTAQLLDTSTESLSAWQGVAKVTGGSAEGITGAIRGLVGQFQQFALTGESAVIPYFRALGINIADVEGKMRPFNDIMLDLSDRLSKLDPAKAAAFGKALGFDEATISLLIRGRDAVRDLLAEQEKIGVVTKQDSQAAQELYERWTLLENRVESMGRTFMTFATRLMNTPNTSNIMKKSTGFGAFIGYLWDLTTPAGRKSRALPQDNPLADLVPPSSLREKAGAGSKSVGIEALARSLQNDVPGLSKFTSFNDAFHAGTKSKHAQGLALDFTISDPSKSGATAEAVRAKLAQMGIDARVLDEYTKPSPGSTGGHIHVQFNSADAAKRYSEMSAINSSLGGGGSTTSTSISINQVVVHTKATDAEGIARDIKPALTGAFATQAQSGPE